MKRRATKSVPLEFIERALLLPPDVEVVNVLFDPVRGVATFVLAGQGLGSEYQCHDGAVPLEIRTPVDEIGSVFRVTPKYAELSLKGKADLLETLGGWVHDERQKVNAQRSR